MLSVNWSSVICQLVQCDLLICPVLSVNWSSVICQLVQCDLLICPAIGPVLSVNWSSVICQLFILVVDVREVAHDMQHQVSGFVSADLKMVNSFDTWHGKLIYGVLVRGDHFLVIRCH